MKKVILFDIDYTLFDTDLFKESDLSTHSLYEEVVDILGKIGERAILGIFSEGNIEFQRNKLVKTDIMKHFNEEDVHIFEEKTTPIPQVIDKYKDHQIYLIDDRPVILERIKKYSSDVITVLINRPKKYWKGDLPTDYRADKEIKNLNELLAIIEE